MLLPIMLMIARMCFVFHLTLRILLSVTKTLLSKTMKRIVLKPKSMKILQLYSYKTHIFIKRALPIICSFSKHLPVFLYKLLVLIISPLEKPLHATRNCIVKIMKDCILFLCLWPGPLLLLLLMFVINQYLLVALRLARAVSYPYDLLIPKLRTFIARVMLCHGYLLHKWDISGLDHIPREGPAMIVYHHGVIPVDYLYLVAMVYLKTGRLVHSIIDRSLVSIPGLQTLAEVLGCSAPDRRGCICLLERGLLVGVAPGGGKQAMLGLGWGRRRGYAIAAATARVPIVTMYTDNINLAYSTTSFSWPFSYLLYVSTRIAIAPVYGGLPVQLTSKLAKPVNIITQDKDECWENKDQSAETFHEQVTDHADKLNKAVCEAMQALMDENHLTDKTHLQALVMWVGGDVDIYQTRCFLTFLPRLLLLFILLLINILTYRLVKYAVWHFITGRGGNIDML